MQTQTQGATSSSRWDTVDSRGDAGYLPGRGVVPIELFVLYIDRPLVSSSFQYRRCSHSALPPPPIPLSPLSPSHLSIPYPNLPPVLLPSNPSLRQLLLFTAFLFRVNLNLLHPRWSGMGSARATSSAPPVSLRVPTNCTCSHSK